MTSLVARLAACLVTSQLAWAAPLTQSDQASRLSQEARAQGRYGAALEQAMQVEDPGQQSLLELQARYWAGDLGGALHAARKGLEQAPQHAELLYYATLLPLDLGVPELAAEALPRLEAVSLPGAGLEDSVAQAYRERCQDFAKRLERQQLRVQQRGQSGQRAKIVVLMAGALCVLSTLALLWLSPRSSARPD